MYRPFDIGQPFVSKSFGHVLMMVVVTFMLLSTPPELGFGG